jgi:hypothetical protein
MWESQAALDQDKRTHLILTPIFLFSAVNLLISISLTIRTDPGYIPEDKEWDMPSKEEEEG